MTYKSTKRKLSSQLNIKYTVSLFVYYERVTAIYEERPVFIYRAALGTAPKPYAVLSTILLYVSYAIYHVMIH